MKRKGKAVTVLTGTGVFVVILVLIGIHWQDLADWYQFRSMFEYLGKNEKGYPEYQHRKTGIVMVKLPRTAALEAFLIAKQWVRNEEWERIFPEGPNVSCGPLRVASLFLSPIHRLPFFSECEEFCRRTGLTLPNKSQWEYACGPLIAPDRRVRANATDAGIEPVDFEEPNRFGLDGVAGPFSPGPALCDRVNRRSPRDAVTFRPAYYPLPRLERLLRF